MSENKRPTQAQRQRWKQAAMEQQAKMKEMIQTLAESYQERSGKYCRTVTVWK